MCWHDDPIRLFLPLLAALKLRWSTNSFIINGIFSLFASNRSLETTNCVTFGPVPEREKGGVYVSIQSICFIKVTTDDGSMNAGECLESGNGDTANRDRWIDREIDQKQQCQKLSQPNWMRQNAKEER